MLDSVDGKIYDFSKVFKMRELTTIEAISR